MNFAALCRLLGGFWIPLSSLFQMRRDAVASGFSPTALRDASRRWPWQQRAGSSGVGLRGDRDQRGGKDCRKQEMFPAILIGILLNGRTGLRLRFMTKASKLATFAAIASWGVADFRASETVDFASSIRTRFRWTAGNRNCELEPLHLKAIIYEASSLSRPPVKGV